MRGIVNTLFMLINILIVAFFSIFWIGSYEKKMELFRQLPYSIILRFLGLATIGFTGMIVMLFLNFLLDKLLSKDINVPAYKKLGIQSLKITTLIALLGTILFFCV